VADTYYLVYSSGENNELAYATSSFPDRDFTYRGVIISNADLGYQGNIAPLNPAGTIHGGIEQVNGQWYVFYHRCTNNTDFSRQACAEPIEILPDGSISQVEITTQGLDGKPIPAHGEIPTAYACNLTVGNRIKLGFGKPQTQPRIITVGKRIKLGLGKPQTQSRKVTSGKKIKLGYGKPQTRPRITEINGETIVADIIDGTQIGFKYFTFTGNERLVITCRGSAKGFWEIRSEATLVGTIPVTPNQHWTRASGSTSFPAGKGDLSLTFFGRGKIDVKCITFY
jgi:hypothetical protein